MKRHGTDDINRSQIPELLGSMGRLRIIEALFQKERLHVSLIAKRCGLNPSTTKDHLQALEEAGLVRHEKIGKRKEYFIVEGSPKTTALGFLFRKWKGAADEVLSADFLGKIRITDLTHDVATKSIIFERDRGDAEVTLPGPRDFHEGLLELGLHNGTHLDVTGTVLKPEKCPAISTLELGKFIGPAVKLDITSKKEIIKRMISRKNTKKFSLVAQTSIEEIVQILMKLEIDTQDVNLEDIKPGDFVLFHTGFDDYWYPGAERPFYRWEPYFIHPYPSRELIEALLDKNIKGLGIDAGTLEPPFTYLTKGQDAWSDATYDIIKEKYPSYFEGMPYAHKKCLEKCIFVENLTNLDKVFAKRFLFMCLPLKLTTSVASPIRAIALETL